MYLLHSLPVYVNSFIHTKTVFWKVKVYTSICFRITGNYFSNKAWRPVNKLSHRTHQISQRIRVRKGKPASITIQHITNYIYLHTCRIFICRYFLRVEEMYLISSINHRIELRFRIERKTNDITVFCIFHRLTRLITGNFLCIIEHLYQTGRIKRIDTCQSLFIARLPGRMPQSRRMYVIQFTYQMVLRIS